MTSGYAADTATSTSDATVAMAFVSWFGLEPAQGRLLALLYRAQGAVAPRELASVASVSATALVQYHLPQLRQALDSEAIDRSSGGYQLTDSGRAECSAVLRQCAEELAAAA